MRGLDAETLGAKLAAVADTAFSVQAEITASLKMDGHDDAVVPDIMGDNSASTIRV